MVHDLTGVSPGEGTGATMSDDEDEQVGSDANLFDGALDGPDSMGFGPLIPTENERSLTERVRPEVKHELKQETCCALVTCWSWVRIRKQPLCICKVVFRAFLLAAGIPNKDVLLRKKRARILKPAFTVIRDKESKCLLVFIRGTQSLKDTLTEAIGAPVSFNHFI
uniref:Uncharacterized protein n=1 Tax=Glycine max TaxID=3847 RepID=K7M6A1_SOYBN